MNTAKFSYNPKRHSLLYLTRKDDFIVEEYDIKKRKIIKTYPLSYSTAVFTTNYSSIFYKQ